jgi:hypothetical protein
MQEKKMDLLSWWTRQLWRKIGDGDGDDDGCVISSRRQPREVDIRRWDGALTPQWE